MRRLVGILLVCLAGWLCSCDSTPPTADAESNQPAKRYKLHGEIVSLEPDGHIAKIRHQEIEGWMKAMTMEYPVKDPAEYARLHVGDCINAIVFVQDLKFWVGEIHQTSADASGCVAQ